MGKDYRLAIVGVQHSHVGSLARWAGELPNVTIVAVADPDRERAQEVADKNGVEAVYEDHEKLLAEQDVDIVLCCSENSRHLTVTRAAMAAGCHVLVEKPMAASFQGALDMLLCARKAGKTLMVNWPSAWNVSFRKMAELVQEGAVGKVFCIRSRYGHGGPDRGLPPEERAQRWWYNEALGGGALLDFCCYGVNLSRWFLGVSPLAVTGMADRLVHDFGDVEDNATLLVRYPGTMCSFEATWSQPAGDGLNGPVVFGSEGTLLAATQDGCEGVLLKRSNEDIQFIPGKDLALGHRSGPEHLVHCLETGEPLFTPVTPELNLEVIAVLQAGENAARTGQTVQLPPFEV